MKKLIPLVIGALLIASNAFGSSVAMYDSDIDVSDLESLNRGAKYFVDYCSGCHAIKHLRYSRMGADFNISEQDMRSSGIMAPGAKIQDSLEGAMHDEDSKEWLGVEPPDLSLIARARGSDWLFTYLKGFYMDPSRPTGTNNILLPNVGMPNVLWQLQGLQEAVFKANSGGEQILERMKPLHMGTMASEQFDQVLNDLVAFLVYAGEPSQFQRHRVAPFVMVGLLVLSIVLYKLKKEYWRDIQ